MSNRERFIEYTRSFEISCITGDFALIAPFFAEDAEHRVEGDSMLAASDRGREAVVSGLETSVKSLDRRFDTRIPEIIDGPTASERGVWMRFRLRLQRAGLAELVVEGEHETIYDEHGLIQRIDETIDPEVQHRVTEYLARHDAQLRPVGSAFNPPDETARVEIESALNRSIVRAYAAAKSQQDVGAALAVCTPTFGITTHPFGTSSATAEETRGQLAVFFHVFPDYHATTTGLIATGNQVAWWGNVTLSFQQDFGAIQATGATATIPATSIFTLRDGSLEHEEFLFDLAALCDGIGVPVAEFRSALLGARVAA